MRLSLPLLGFLALSLAGTPAGAVGRAPAVSLGSELRIAEPLGDFGQVWEGAVLTHRFALEAVGPDDLVIHKIQAACGCTVADVWRVAPSGERELYVEGEAIAPGARIELSASFATLGRLGPQSKPISIYHSGRGSKLDVRIEAQVQPFLEAQPRSIELGKVPARGTSRGSTEVRVANGERVKLELDPEQRPEWLEVELLPLDAADDGRAARWRVDAELRSGAPEGFLRETLRLRTDRPHAGADEFDDGRPQFLGQDLQVTALVLGRVTAKPSYLSFGQVRAGMLVARSTRVNVYDAEIAELPDPSWTVLDGKLDVPFHHAEACRVTVRPVEGVRGWDVELALDGLPDELRGAFHGRLRLSFPETDLPDLELAFSGFHRVPNPGPGGPGAGGSPDRSR